MLDTLKQDIRFTARALRHSPGFAAVMVLTLALGIGANTAIFSVVETVLLKPLPYPHDDQLVELWTSGMGGLANSRFALSYPEYQDIKGLRNDLSDAAVYTESRYNLTGIGEPREVQAELASPALFNVLGVRPALGRGFNESELREPVAVLSHGLWMQLFGSDPAAIGRTIMLDDRGYTVVGVMPAGFEFPDEGTQLWVPLGAAFIAQPAMETNPDFHALNAIVRLRGGVDISRLESDLSVLAARIDAQRKPQAGGRREMRVVQSGGPPPGGSGGPRVRMRSGNDQTSFTAQRLRDEVVGNARTPLIVLMAVVGFVLLIACVNAANLLLARAGARQRELAVRRALGAGRGRLVRQLLTESVLLALAAGLVGLFFAVLGLRAILASWPALLPRTQAIGLDATTLAFAFGVSLLTGIIFGLAPALRSSGPGLETSLREGAVGVTAGPRRHRLQRGLMVAEIALALVVLTGAGLLVRSFVELNQVDPGYDTHGVLAARIRLTPARYPEQAQQQQFFQQVIQELQRQPGVEGASPSRTLPMSGQIQMLAMDPRTVRPDDPQPFLAMGLGIVGPGFFRALHIPLLAGRTFTDQDREGGQPVAVINTELAKQLWPGEDPIGRTIPLGLPGHQAQGPTDVTVIGEIGDVHYASLTDPVKPEIYLPFAQANGVSERGAWIIARAGHDPLALATTLRKAVETIDAQQPVATVTTLSQMISRSTASRRFNMTLVSLFALLALGLAVVGIYGVTAYTVGQRTQEIGVRVALGAARLDVIRLLLGETAVMAGMGIVLGLAGALAATRVLASLLYGVSPTDIITFAATALVLALAALLAALMPARRAARIDPVRALKYE